MTLNRSVLATLLGLSAGLIACSSTSVSVTPAGPDAQPIAQLAPQENQTRPQLSEPDQTNLAQADPAVAACFNMTAYDPADTSVNLRDQPDGSVITSLPNLTQVQAEGPAGADPEWNRVYVVDSGEQGYIWGELLYRSYYQVLDPQDTSANLRQSPNGEMVSAIANKSLVRFLGIDGNWTKVELSSGQQGYILTELLARPDCF